MVPPYVAAVADAASIDHSLLVSAARGETVAVASYCIVTPPGTRCGTSSLLRHDGRTWGVGPDATPDAVDRWNAACRSLRSAKKRAKALGLPAPETEADRQAVSTIHDARKGGTMRELDADALRRVYDALRASDAPADGDPVEIPALR